MDKSTGQQAKAVITGMGTIIACLTFLSLSTLAFGQREPTPARLDQAQAGKQARTIDLQLRHSFNIPSESLNVALTDFSAQSRMHVVTSGVPADVLSPGVNGDVSTLNALTALLHGTGMSFRQVDAETLVVAPEQTARARPTQFQLAADAFADQPPGTAAAPAAGAPAEPNALQEVTVSASAISIAGYQAPTPVTAIGIQQLESGAQPDLGDALRQLPVVIGSPGPQNNGTSGDISDARGGLDLINLRNLGTGRTLVLFDGQRVVQASSAGGVDVSMIPSSLVERVETVTGGASATWGSDAIAGVINLIINKNYNGFQINFTESLNDQGLHRQDKADFAAGTPFADGRGHVEVAGSYWNAPDFYSVTSVPGFNAPALVSNPACSKYSAVNATCPAGQYIWHKATGVGYSTGTEGGIITAGLQRQPISLVNTAFGLNGQPYTFYPGNVSENLFTNGGTPNYDNNFYGANSPLKNETGFGLISFKFSDALRASLQLNYAHTSTYTFANSEKQLGSVPIYSGNPYIPPSVQAQMTAEGLPGFLLGTLDLNNIIGNPNSLGAVLQTLGAPVAYNARTLLRGVFTLDGSLGSSWSWQAYYMHGQNHDDAISVNNTDIPNLQEAENAVLVTSAIHAAVPSLAAGSITCAANVPLTLLPGGASGQVAKTAIYADATPNCQPLNVMGLGVASDAALRYIKGPATGANDSFTGTLFESVTAGSVQGLLPFGLPAGPIAAAAGLLYRNESVIGTGCGVRCQNVDFHVANFVDQTGSYNVKEANAEINVPVLKDQGVRTLSFDAAARWSDYSTSGAVETYKFGVVSQVTDWLRFRGSYSYDIRAPNLKELFQIPQSEGGTLIDPRTGQSTQGYSLNEGNPALHPENAETRTFGFVLTPVPGLVASIDLYYILFKDVITAGFTSTVSESQCIAGVAAFCENLLYGHYPNNFCSGPTLNSCPLSLPFSDTISDPLNADSETLSGFDFNGDYRMPFMAGAMDFNAAVNYAFEDRFSQLGTTSESLNSLGAEESVYSVGGGGGVPKFHGTVGATYTQGGWLGTVQSRLVGSAWLVSQWINTNYLSNEDNKIAFVTYFDLRLSYRWDNGLQLYGALDNVLDKYAPFIYHTPFGSSSFRLPIDGNSYDVYGRVWRLGLRYRFGG